MIFLSSTNDYAKGAKGIPIKNYLTLNNHNSASYLTVVKHHHTTPRIAYLFSIKFLIFV